MTAMTSLLLLAAAVFVLVGCTQPESAEQFAVQPAEPPADRPVERCHLFRSTASDPVITEWDVGADRCTGYHIRERVDAEGRVVELRFMDGDSLYEGTVYVPAIVRYEYGNGIIVGTAYLDEDEPLGGEIGAPFRTTYRIDGNRLLGCRDEYVPNAFAEGEEPPDEELEGVIGCPYITYYLYSRAKMGGVNPVAEGFDWNTVHLPYDESILRAGDYDL
jgi:hypothetical protein